MSYLQLTKNEYCCIYNFKNSGLSIRDIAKALNRSLSTISRELKRNSYINSSKYQPTIAQNKYENRR